MNKGTWFGAFGFLCITVMAVGVICNTVGFNSADAKEIVLVAISAIGGAIAGGGAVYAYMKHAQAPGENSHG